MTVWRPCCDPGSRSLPGRRRQDYCGLVDSLLRCHARQGDGTERSTTEDSLAGAGDTATGRCVGVRLDVTHIPDDGRRRLPRATQLL